MNTDSTEPLEAVLGEWVDGQHEVPVQAVVVLGPDPFGTHDDRQVVAVHPPRAAAAARALAASSDFGAQWRASDAPLAAWQSVPRADAPLDHWRSLFAGLGLQSLVRVEFPLPAGRAFECFVFSPRELAGRGEASALVWACLNVWPLIRRAIAAERSRLSPRERECLALAFEGLTARESAGRLQCSERTVNYHLANAMGKLKVDSKLAAIQRACWLGAL